MPRGSTWAPEEDEKLRQLWLGGVRGKALIEAMGKTPGQIAGRAMHLHLPAGRIDGQARRYQSPTNAVREARSQFPRRVRDVDDQPLLKEGSQQRKIGQRVLKGAWKGMRIYTLTLEERATCPDDCAMFVGCYGNNMSRAVRYRAGPALEAKLAIELAELARINPRGFVVRLHILGDFYSLAYVDFWRRALDQYPFLRIFGYTAYQSTSPIGAEIVRLRRANWDRFAVRTSGAPSGKRAIVIEHENDKPSYAVICPAEREDLWRRGKTITCASCALCWTTPKTIAFLRH